MSGEAAAHDAAGTAVRGDAREAMKRLLSHCDAVLAHLPDGVLVKDADNRIVWANPGAATLLGVPMEDLVGQHAADPMFDARLLNGQPLAAPDLPSTCALANGEPVVGFAMDLARGDGQRVQVEMSTRALLDSHGHTYAALSVVRDLRPRMTEQQGLRFQAELLDTVGQAVIATDPRGRTTYWNKAAEELYGWSAEEALGRDIDEVRPSSVTVEQASQLRARLAAGEPWTGELMVHDKQGRKFPALVTDRPSISPDGTLLAIISVSMDLTERKHREEEMQHLSAIVSSSADAIFSIDPDRRISSWNLAAERLLGHPAEEVIGQPVESLPPTEVERAELASLIARVLGGESIQAFTMTPRRRDGTPVDVSITTFPLHHEDGSVAGASAIIRDVSEQRAMQRAIEHQARHDALTGLANRTLLEERLHEHLAAQSGASLAVLFIDLDNFKTINDVVGHAAGDEVLVEVAARLTNAVRSTDTVARFGGDEFVVVADAATLDEARALADRIQASLDEVLVAGGRPVRVGTSIGIALTPPHEPARLLAHADAAMYDAKSRGRDQITVFDHRLSQRASDQLELAHDLRDAIEHDQLAMRYQPIHHLESDHLLGVEATCQWAHPRHGLIPAARVVEVGEEAGLLPALDRWTLTHAARDLRRLLDQDLLQAGQRVWVDLKTRDSADHRLVQLVTDAMRSPGIPYQSLGLQVSEASLTGDPEESLTALHTLREQGISITVDDFGSGNASVKYLRDLPLDNVKVDPDLTAHVSHDGADQQIAGAVIALAQAIGAQAVATGVTNRHQVQALHALGCRAGQGPLWSPPMHPDQLPALLRGDETHHAIACTTSL